VEKGRRFPILRSKNFTDWEYIGGALEPLDDPNTDVY
jgi:arabinan endo-1,5-alpha-L-arabinosidase